MSICKYCGNPIEGEPVMNPDEYGNGYHHFCLVDKEFREERRRIYNKGRADAFKWIPIKTRSMTDEEVTYYRDWAEYATEIFDCPLPEDGQEVLVSWGNNVSVDVFVRDTDGCYFEDRDIDEVTAWMPLPEPWKGESE